MVLFPLYSYVIELYIEQRNLFYLNTNKTRKKNPLRKVFFSDPFMFSVPLETNHTTLDCQSIARA